VLFVLVLAKKTFSRQHGSTNSAALILYTGINLLFGGNKREEDTVMKKRILTTVTALVLTLGLFGGFQVFEPTAWGPPIEAVSFE
jgi:hypothetical protein